jgi:diguanylate cyclase (GGDEF)-like protein
MGQAGAMDELERQRIRGEALDELCDGYWLVEPLESGCRVLDCNQVGRLLLEVLGSRIDRVEEPQLLELIAQDPPQRAELTVAMSRGGERALDVRSFRLDGWPSGVRALELRDVTAALQVERQQSMLANYDSLTGLPNRRLFENQLAGAIQRAEANDTVVALLMLDLDEFKQTNDSLGHAAGDELLAFVAEAIRGIVRGDDVVSRIGAGPEDRNVARLGGDEFAIILSDVARSEDSTDIAARVLHALATPLEIQGTPVIPSGSIGVAVYPQDASSAEALAVAADQALYKAKELGRNQCQLYHPTLNDRAGRRREVARELAQAIANDDLEVVYQPIVGLRECDVRGAEARLRWIHPELGETPVAEFVDIAEKTGLVERLGRWQLDRVLSDIAKHGGEHFDGRVGVQVSSIELRNPRYAECVSEQIEASAVSPRQLELEITDRAFLAKSAAIARNLSDLRKLGVSILIEDFGTGRSSLSDLLEHRLDGVKIDGAFVSGHQGDRVASGVLRALVQLAGELRIHAIVQGVATAEEAASLRKLGCEQAQGPYFGDAVPAEDYFAMFGTLLERGD